MDLQRQLVTLRTIAEIKPIPNADNIELAVVDGWQCVVKKGEFKVGDIGIYFEIDSFIPLSPGVGGDSPFEFLRKDAREWNGLYGTRIKTIKLRGQISQGLLLSDQTIPSPLPLQEGVTFDNLADHFGVVKYEKEPPQQEMRQDHWTDAIIRFFVPKRWRPTVFGWLRSKRKPKVSKSSFPSFIPKTDEERVQNVIGKLLGQVGVYEVTVKLDGSSMTCYIKDGVFGLCSRNVKKGIEDGSNFAKVAKAYNLSEVMGKANWNFALQGELLGPGIQGNNEGFNDHDWFIFNIWDIDAQRYLSREERDEALKDLAAFGCKLKKAPSLGLVNLNDFKSIDDYLAFAEGPSLNPASKREGVVFRDVNGSSSFKAIANSYLLKHSDRS